MTARRNKTKDMQDWQAESDCNTLIEAEKIKADPQRLARAQTYAQKKLQSTAKVIGLEATKAKAE